MTARLYIQPPDGSPMRKLDIPSKVTLTVLDPDERERDTFTTRTLDGSHTSSWGGRSSLDLIMVWDLIETDATLRDWHMRIASVMDWIDRGMSFGIARDADKAGLWPLVDTAGTGLRGGQSDGATTTKIGADYLGWETSPALAEDDLVSIESDAPESQRHCTALDAVGAGPPVALTYANAVWGDILNESWVRHRDFYPYLARRDEDRGVPALIQEDRGVRFTLTLRCVQNLPAVVLE